MPKERTKKTGNKNLTPQKNNNRHNALVHGLYASDVLLPGENIEDFEFLLNELKAEFDPQGRSENETVFTIGLQYWRKRRLYVSERNSCKGDPVARKLSKGSEKGWRPIRKALPSPVRTFEPSTMAEFGIAMAKSANAISLDLAKANGEETARLKQNLEIITNVYRDRLQPVLDLIEKALHASEGLQKSFTPEQIGSLARVEAQIDAYIGRLMARLFDMQERKRFKRSVAVTPKIIEHQSSSA